MDIRLRYGKQGLEVTLPDRNVKHVLRLNRLPSIEAPRARVNAAATQPSGMPSLTDVVKGRKNACIVVSDITRPVPNGCITGTLVDHLLAGGLREEDILVLVATGLHRGNSRAELREMGLGEVLDRGIRVENHEARDAGSHVALGSSSMGIPVEIDRRYVEAEVRVLTGLVEPHLMAGYSGGAKAVCPGLCSAETIMSWHSPAMLAPPESRAGNIRGNRVQEQAREIAAMAGPVDFLLNVTIDDARNVTGVFGGELVHTHLQAMRQAERQSKVVLDEPVDVVVTTNAGHPLDLTYYQGIKGMVGAMPIVKPGGTIIIAQENAEGIGGPEFTGLLREARSPAEFMARAFAGEVSCIDQWQVQELDLVLRHCEVLNYGTGIDPETQRGLFVEPIASVEEGVRAALTRHGADATVAVIPEGPYVLACLKDDIVGSRSVGDDAP